MKLKNMSQEELQLLSYTDLTYKILKEEKKPMSELCSIMKELPQVLVNAKVPNDKKNIYLEDKEIVAEIERIEKLLEGRGRVLIRPSGTEPLVRVMLEGENQEEIRKCLDSLKNQTKQDSFQLDNLL